MKKLLKKSITHLTLAIVSLTFASCGTSGTHSELKFNSEKTAVRLPSKMTCKISRSPVAMEEVVIKLNTNTPVIRDDALNSVIVSGKEIELGSIWEAYKNDDQTISFGSPGCDYLTEFRFSIKDFVSQKRNLRGIESFSIRDDKPTETSMNCIATY